MVSPHHIEEDQDNNADSETVTINGFMFCAPHGLEYCHRCFSDYRGTNNVSIEDILDEKLTEEELDFKWEGEDREPISIAYQWTLVAKGTPGCIEHEKIACQQCFNWGEQVTRPIINERNRR